MATKKTISSKFVTVPKKYGGKKSGTHEVELAYITKEEAEHLKKLDLHNSGIDKENHYGPKGIPNYDGDAGGGDADYGDGGGEPETGTETDRDDSASEIACERAGGTWENGVCVMPDGDGDSDGDGDGDEDIDETWEKADPYETVAEKDRIAKPFSETERVQKKRDTGTTFAESVVKTMMGERKGLGAKSEELASIDMNRDAMEAQLAAAQKWASKGMSYSKSHFDDEEKRIRDFSRNRALTAAEGQKIQTEFDLAAWNNSTNMQKLAAASKLSATGQPGGFQPGEIDVAEVMEPNFGLTLPGFSGLPENLSKIFTDYNENPLYQLAENITDPAGNVCDYNELDENGYCPITA